MRSTIYGFCKLGFISFLAIIAAIDLIFSQKDVAAQVVPDRTLGLESSLVNPNSQIEIEGGAIRGENLFHSFEKFNVDEGRGVYFNNPTGIQRIFTRVTGNSVSEILGTLGVLGNADLFLLNPNGIIFGSKAVLDLKGSFLATTASSLLFEDGIEFSAKVSSIPSLLSVSIPVGLQFRETVGEIIQQPTSFVDSNGIEGQPGKTLAFVGGDITLRGGYIASPEGRIELGSVGENSYVSLHSIQEGWALSYEGVQKFHDLKIIQAAALYAFSSNIQVQNLVIKDGSQINVFSGNIQVQNLVIKDGSQIFTIGGTIKVMASETVEITGFDPNFPGVFSGLANEATSDKDAGSITIDTRRLIIRDGGRISTKSTGVISGENLTIATGKGGNLIVNASESVELTGSSEGSTGLFAGTESFGDAGNITIETQKLTIQDGAKISAETTGATFLEQPIATGKGGDINIIASESVNINGGFFSTETRGLGGNAGNIRIETGQLNMNDGAGILASTFSPFSQGGDITLRALNSLQVNNSNISASTQSGRAGNLTVKAAESIEVSGKSSLSVEATGGGTAGNLSVETIQINVSERSKVSVSSTQGQAGNLKIAANSLNLNRGTISAETAKSGSESGANITLELSDLLKLDKESLISATANGDANGGNIDINSPLLAVFSPTGANGSDIIAKAERGNGGNITIQAEGIFGIAERRAIEGNRSNDIDASSQFGKSGQVQINSTIDPDRVITQLPETVVDPNALVAQNPCKRGFQSQFSQTGRGGLPPSPNEDLSSEATQVGLVEPAPSNLAEERTKKDSADIISASENPIVPAQGWIFNEKGEVVLTTYNPSVTGTQRQKENPAGCPAY